MVTETQTRPIVAEAPREIAVLKRREWSRLFAQPDRRRTKGKRDAALLAVLLGAGLRVGECCRLTVEAVEVEHGYTRIRTRTSTQKVRAGARPPARVVTLFPLAAKLLNDYIRHAEPRYWLFSGHQGEHLSTRAANGIVKRYLRQIGRGDLHCHDLRHSFATEVIRTSRSIFVCAKLLGHADPRTTQGFYAAWDSSEADAASDLLGPVISPRKYKEDRR